MVDIRGERERWLKRSGTGLVEVERDVCLRNLSSRKRCRKIEDQRRPCVCDYLGRLMDHPATLKRTGAKVLLVEPYLRPEDVHAALSDLAPVLVEHGVSAAAGAPGSGPWSAAIDDAEREQDGVPLVPVAFSGEAGLARALTGAEREYGRACTSKEHGAALTGAAGVRAPRGI